MPLEGRAWRGDARLDATPQAMPKYCRPVALGFIAWSYKASPTARRSGRRVFGFGFVCVDEAREELGELAEVVGREGADRVGRAQQDGVCGRDGVVPAGCEGDQLATPIVGVRLALDKAVRLQLVDNEGRVRGVDAVCLSQLAEGHWSVAELEEDLASPAAEAESERFSELASAAVDIDEPLHEGPGLLNGIS
jgi:hypothetical protein